MKFGAGETGWRPMFGSGQWRLNTNSTTCAEMLRLLGCG